MVDSYDGRDFRRMNIDCEVVVRRIAEDVSLNGRANNLSATGLLFTCAESIIVFSLTSDNVVNAVLVESVTKMNSGYIFSSLDLNVASTAVSLSKTMARCLACLPAARWVCLIVVTRS